MFRLVKGVVALFNGFARSLVPSTRFGVAAALICCGCGSGLASTPRGNGRPSTSVRGEIPRKSQTQDLPARSSEEGEMPQPSLERTTTIAESGIASVSPSATGPGGLPAGVGSPEPGSVVPPAPVEPPFARSAKPGDGGWASYRSGPESKAQLWTTVLHPHSTSPFVQVSVVAMDLRLLTLQWVVGAGDRGADKLAAVMAPGMIPAEVDEPVAIFNGGFQARHGHWGQLSHGETLVEPRETGCGVAIYANGSIDLGTFATVGARPELVSYRETPPCLISEGQINPALLSGRDAAWAGKSEREKTRRRSALGLRRRDAQLFYLTGVETEAVDLARALSALGVDVGLELDINWNWTRFFLVDRNGGTTRVHSPLLDGMVIDAGEYVTRPSKRDFFVVSRRP